MALLTLAVTTEGGEEALRQVSALTGPDRTAAHQVMSAGLERLTSDYLRTRGGGKQSSAAKLGASSSGFYAKAAGTVQGKGDSTGILLSMQRPGLSRAFRPYDLVPRAGQLLTIPVAAEAYGKRAREFPGGKWRSFDDQDVAEGRSDKAGLVFGMPAAEPGGLFHALFRGARKVHQDQDRAILPGDEDWLDEAANGALDYLDGRAAV